MKESSCEGNGETRDDAGWMQNVQRKLSGTAAKRRSPERGWKETRNMQGSRRYRGWQGIWDDTVW